MKSEGKTIKGKKQNYVLLAALLFLLGAAAWAAMTMNGSKEEEIVYKETKAEYGMLTVGVSKSGAVDIGTTTQKFDLDMSALKRADTGSSSGSSSSSSGSSSSGGASAQGGTGAPMGMGTSVKIEAPSGTGSSGGGNAGGIFNLFSQMFGGAAASTGNTDASSLTISAIKISVGQEVSAGDVLFEVEKEDVEDLEKELQDNVEKAKADLDAVYADQKLSGQTAKYTYESSLAYGTYAQTGYNNELLKLQEAVETNRINLERAQASLTEYQTRLQSVTTSYENAAQAQKNCEYSLSHTDSMDVYLYQYYYNLTEQAKQTADSLKQQKEQLENNVEQAETNVETLTKNYNTSKRSLEQGKLDAAQTLSLRNLAYANAKEVYDVTLAYLEDEVTAQEETYEEAKEKWEEYSSYINGNSVLSKYDGIITSIELSEGDSIKTGSSLITLYNMEDVSMTVKLYEKDMTDITRGMAANIVFTAYPEQMFAAVVSEISEASTDSKGNVVYDVTVNVEGDVSGLFQGMTGDITFITGESEETLYVSKRAVTIEDNKSYVKIRKEDGAVVRKEVITGFTDGTYIQIKEGLSEGDIVLIESKVSGS